MCSAWTIDKLCQLIALQNEIIQAQAAALAQLDAEIMADEIAETEKQKEMLL